ncbi:MAG: sulfatase [Verrucomicrobiota bacterium]
MKRIFLLSLFFSAFLVGRSVAAPNVLLITADDLGLQLSCYGDPYIETPEIDAFAASGVKFTTAYVTQASCSSSRSSMFTGLYPHTTGQLGLANGGFVLFPDQVGKNLPRYLKEAGYRTGIFGKLHVAPESSFPFDHRPKLGNTRDVRAVAAAAKEFFGESAEEPFFLMVNYSDPHFYKDSKDGKIVFPPQWMGIPKEPIPDSTIPGWDFQGFDEPIARKRTTDYYNTVKRFDTGVGMLLDALEESGRVEDTLVILLSDHGPPFRRGKTTCYESGLRVPFLVRWPGVSKAGLESSALVSTVDIVPTILDAAGAESPVEFHGRSLRETLATSDPPEEWRQYLAGEFHFHGPKPFFPRRAIRDQRFKLIYNPLAGKVKPPGRVDADPVGQFVDHEKYVDTPAGKAFQRYLDPPEWELYDLENDPLEFVNLAKDPAMGGDLKRLRTALTKWQETTDDPLLEEETFTRFEKLGEEAAERSGR